MFKSTLKRAFHTTCIAREEWTKASLRRMKKVELTRLGQENNLKLSGTKNDIIIQLLTHQTARIVGSATPSVQTIQSTGKTATEEEENDEPNEAWVDAFEMKVAQRGTRKLAIDFTHKESKPHRFNEQLKASTLIQPAQDKPKATSTAAAVPVIESTKTTQPDQVEGMDAQWVEAFDLKVGSRSARSKAVDTISSFTSPLESLGPVDKVEQEDKKEEKIPVGKKYDHVKKHTEQHGKQHYHDINKNKINKSDTPLKEDTTLEQNDARDKVTAVVGSSMFIWYFGDSLSKIWYFLSS